MGEHRCHAPGCVQPTERRMLMCPACWALVSPEHRTAVWAEYRPGQEMGRTPVSIDWVAAVADAKADVMQAKGADGSGYRAMAARLRGGA
jgi:hypothetical protein